MLSTSQDILNTKDNVRKNKEIAISVPQNIYFTLFEHTLLKNACIKSILMRHGETVVTAYINELSPQLPGN